MKDDLRNEALKCPCGAWTKPKYFTIDGLKIRGSRCPKCKEEYLNGQDVVMLHEYRKLRDGKLEGKVGVTGNSYTIRIPIGLVRALGLKKGDTVNIKIKSLKEIIISTG